MAMENDTSRIPRRGTNFILLRIDPFDSVIAWTVTGMLIAAGVVTAIVTLTSLYKYKLQTDLVKVDSEIEAVAMQIRGKAEFEKRFLTAQAKLELYEAEDEKDHLAEVFPILSSLIPSGVQVKDMTIDQEKVSMTCTASSRQAFTVLSTNIEAADGRQFGNNTLHVGNLDVQEVIQSNSRSSDENSEYAYQSSLTFNYSVELGENSTQVDASTEEMEEE